MSYTVAIVDDEVLVRKSIKMKLNNPGFTVVFDTDDGQVLLDYLSENGHTSIDIILIDIIMPLMNGLECIERVKELVPDMLFVVLTSYNEYSYMRQSIKLGVEDYVLKPIDPEALNSVLKALQQKLSTRYEYRMQKCINSISYYLSSKNRSDITKENMEILDKSFKGGFRLEISVLGNWLSSQSWLKLSYETKWSFIYEGHLNILVHLIASDKISEPLDVNCKSTMTKFLSGKIENVTDIIITLEKCFSLLKQCICLDENIILLEEQVPSNILQEHSSAWNQKENRYLPLILKSLEIKSFNKTLEYLEELFLYENTPQILVENTWNRIYVEICKHCSINGFWDTDYIKSIDSRESFKKRILEISQDLLYGNTDDALPKNNKKIVEHLLEYLKIHYPENVSLNDIADRFFISRSHLSRILKQETSLTFIDMLTEIRISKAKELLKGGNGNINEVSQLVGYEDSRYFSQVFRKYTGLSPSEHRDKD